jgi:hypothetical protein
MGRGTCRSRGGGREVGRSSGGCRGGGRGGRGRNDNDPAHHNQEQQRQIEESDILKIGLRLVGFSDRRQNVSSDLNNKRFRAFFGIGTKAACVLFYKLKSERFEPEIEKLLMTLN